MPGLRRRLILLAVALVAFAAAHGGAATLERQHLRDSFRANTRNALVLVNERVQSADPTGDPVPPERCEPDLGPRQHRRRTAWTQPCLHGRLLRRCGYAHCDGACQLSGLRLSQGPVPIPRGAKTPSELNPNNREPTMVVMQRGTGSEWSMFKITAPGETPLSSVNSLRCPKNGDWNAIIVTKFDPATGAGGWQGLANEVCCSGAASQIYYPAGLVRPRDVRSTAPTWGHALSMNYGGILAGAFVYPAKGHGGFCKNANSCVPMGARFQLDPSFDCSRTRLLVHRWERQACRTMQVYGMIVKDTMCIWPCRGIGYDVVNSYAVRLPIGRHVDGGGSYRFPFDTASGYREMPVEILRHLHVIDWTKWTGARVLVATVERSGAVSLRDARGRSVARVTGGSYVIIVRDRSRRHGLRLAAPQQKLLRLSGKKYVGTVRRRISLVRGTYRYSGGARRATFTVG